MGDLEQRAAVRVLAAKRCRIGQLFVGGHLAPILLVGADAHRAGAAGEGARRVPFMEPARRASDRRFGRAHDDVHARILPHSRESRQALLQNSGPIFARGDMTDHRSANPKPIADLFLCKAPHEQFSNFAHRLFGQLVAIGALWGRPPFLTSRTRAKPVAVQRVLRTRHPPNVTSRVVLAVPIPMGDIMFRRRRRPVERFADESMHKELSSGPPPGKQDNATIDRASGMETNKAAGTSSLSTLSAPHAPEAADFIRPAFDGPPLFGGRIRGIGLVSHGDLQLGRGGQGSVRASNSPGPANIAQNRAQSHESRPFLSGFRWNAMVRNRPFAELEPEVLLDADGPHTSLHHETLNGGIRFVPRSWGHSTKFPRRTESGFCIGLST